MLQRHIIVEEVFLDNITDTKTFKTDLGDDIDIVKVGTGKSSCWAVSKQIK